MKELQDGTSGKNTNNRQIGLNKYAPGYQKEYINKD